MSRIKKERLKDQAKELLFLASDQHETLKLWQPDEERTADYMVGVATAVLEGIEWRAKRLLEGIEGIEE